MKHDIFHAIADPTRRKIIGLVARERLNLNALADHFDISRPAVSKHVKILMECGVVIVKQEGRERYCEARLKELDRVTKWVEMHRTMWADKLSALDKYLGGTHKKSIKTKQSKP